MRSDLVGQAKLLARHVSKDSQPPSVFTVEGNGTTNVAVGPGFPSVSWMSLTVDLTTCEYTIHTETGVNATHTDRNGSSVMGVAGISIINSERRRVGSGPSFDMSGGGSFTVRSPTWRASTTVDRYMPFGITIYEINRPDELGKASVRWSISPAPQASSPAGN